MATKIIETLIRRWRQWRRRRNLGARGEALAARELERKGFEILERGWRCRQGEIDIVARDAGTVVIVEVKTRARHGHFAPVDAVDAKKQRKLVHLADAYARARLRGRDANAAIRFDVVGITMPHGSRPEIEHIRNAFDA